MNAIVEDFAALALPSIDAAIDAVCNLVAPTWPLDRYIAVHPYWGWVDRPIERAAEELDRLCGSAMWMPRSYYREALREGRFAREHVVQAARELGMTEAVDALMARLHRRDAHAAGLPLLSDVLDAHRDLRHLPSWRQTIVHQVSQFCAARFDAGQADWRPVRDERLFVAWRDGLASDPGLELLMDAPEAAKRAAELPGDSREAIAAVLARLEVPPESVADLLAASLFRVGGWAAWCAYLRWQARLHADDDDSIVDLLAISVAWEALIDDGTRGPDSHWRRWRQALREATQPGARPGIDHLGVFQRAMEIAYEASLAAALESASAAPGPAVPEVQAVFCIDVRSEVYRRALERVAPGVQTIGFAGFFGLPASYAPLGTDAERPQLPGLLAPSLRLTDTLGDESADRTLIDARRRRLTGFARWCSFTRMPASSFGFVEAAGWSYLGKLLQRSLLGSSSAKVDRFGLQDNEARRLQPRFLLSGHDVLDRKTALAEGILRGMSLVDRFARIVALVGHGSSSANNPHAAGLDCGACCGQTGETNARTLAVLLNDVAVRAGLRSRGVVVPESTYFLAALHDTTTDEIEVFGTDALPESHAGDLARLRIALAAAGERSRAERASALGLGHLVGRPSALRRALRSRARDWSETRPEWGLAGNAAFIAAPRGRTQGIDLAGRAFLHDYDWRIDPEGKVLELIMTAPMIVAHWINMQYNASTTDPLRYGSGNKVLHNVVGGRIGVFEGNGGDLRIGLPRQSLHDGKRWMHTPQRLSVFIEAPRSRIDAVLAKHTLVRMLVRHRWLHLFCIDPVSSRVEALDPQRA